MRRINLLNSLLSWTVKLQNCAAFFAVNLDAPQILHQNGLYFTESSIRRKFSAYIYDNIFAVIKQEKVQFLLLFFGYLICLLVGRPLIFLRLYLPSRQTSTGFVSISHYFSAFPANITDTFVRAANIIKYCVQNFDWHLCFDVGR